MRKYSEKDYLDAISELVDATVAKYGGEVKAIYAGGSVARGDFVPGRSDIDIYVAAKGEKKKLQRNLEREARKIEKQYFEDLRRIYAEFLGVTVTTLEEIQNGTSFLGAGFEYHNFINSGKLLWGDDIKALIPKPTPKEQRESAQNFLKNLFESVPEWERKFKWFKWIPLILIPKSNKERLTRQAFCVIFRTAAVTLCGEGVYVSAKADISTAFIDRYSKEKELCDVISNALSLWEKWKTTSLSDKEIKQLSGNSLKFVRELQSLPNFLAVPSEYQEGK